MFTRKKQTDQDRDRMGRQRAPRAADRGKAAVFSYHASRSSRPGGTGRNEQTAAHATSATDARHAGIRLTALKRMPPAVLVAIIVILAVCNSFLAGSPRVALDAQTADAAVPLRSPTAYTDAANALAGASVLNHNKLTANTDAIAAGMRAQFPELSQVTVSVPFIGAALVVHVAAAQPQLLLNVGADLFVVDGAGRALLPANQVPNIEKLELPVVTDQSGLTVTPGKPALSSGNVLFITEVIGQLKAKGLTVTSVTLPAGTSEMDIRISGVSYMGKFNLQGNGRVQAGAFLAVKGQLERDHKGVSKYIDVRVEDRAYYQ